MAMRKFRIVRKENDTGDEVEEIAWTNGLSSARERVELEEDEHGTFFEVQKFECSAVVDQIFPR